MARDPRDKNSRPHRSTQSTWGSISARRGFDRTPFQGTARLTAGEQIYPSQTGNLSTGGVFLQMDTPPDIGTRVKVVIQLHNRLSLYADGVVRWHDLDTNLQRLGCGVEFDALTDVQRSTILQTLDAAMQQQEAGQTEEVVWFAATGTE